MWSRKFHQCIACGRSDRPHMAKGKCSYCYSNEYQADPRNHERVQKQKAEHYVRSVGPAGNKIAREERWFGGNREAALQRDGYKCCRCTESDLSKLIVHHKDGNGRGSVSPNNALENLITLCRACHPEEHGESNGWSRNFDCCQLCGTTERKHNAKGLCWKCYLSQQAHI